MKNWIIACSVLFCFMIVPCLGYSMLLPTHKPDTIKDTATNKYWMTDLTIFANMSYAQQIESIDSSTYLGLNWHMASGDELRGLWFENYDFLDVFEGPGIYSARVDSPTNYAFGGDWANPWGADFTNGIDSAHSVGMFGWDGFMLAVNSGFNFYAYDDLSDSRLGAWVVADGGLAVPEPRTFILLFVGIFGLQLLCYVFGTKGGKLIG